MADGSFRLGPDGIYRCDAFQVFVWQKHGFGTRHANPRADVTLRQIHSDRVLNARELSDRETEGDALITDEIGKSVGVRTADCVAILLLDARTRAVAAVHAGWRGTAANLVQHTLESMRANFHTDPANVYAAMGPCIRGCCYEVGAEVATRFEPLFPEWEGVAGSRKMDLPEANRRQMQTAGVNPDRIFDSGLCTACQSAQFFSFRREPENRGRMIAAISRLA
ncbi:MAG: peptidoglycan editing factor PgeF [Acidobacteriaceae bacterium]|nr:peptidoglycan editing factor PgeF [Acidobacteriaceae bacterium]MBV9781334.1 peptidoglycan editing factor PgeF [Acidobacteriaceae bacterium]